jgi:hypothetical protein
MAAVPGVDRLKLVEDHVAVISRQHLGHHPGTAV